MAAEVDSRPVVSTKRLEGSLVALRASESVPNHLTAIRSFTQPGGHSGVLQTSPTVLHFSGYRVGNVHKQTLRVINASKDNQHMHIIPPSTPFFSIQYTKQRSRLVPGLSLDITVQFRPTEWKYYYDCIRIHCKDEQNLLVPIHAYPVMSTAKFPSHVRFPATPVGRTRNKTLSLECDVPIDFEFQLTAVQHHPAFVVTPMRGIVPANGKVDVMVTFAPTEFSTAIMKLKLDLTQFNSSPLICTFSGSSVPGLDIESVGSSAQTSLPAKLTKTITLPPLRGLVGGVGHSKRGKSGKREAKVKKSVKSSKTVANKEQKEVQYEGCSFPTKMNNPAAVSRVLTQRPSHQCTKPTLLAGDIGVSDGSASRHTREAQFLQRVQKTAKEERANRLRWVTRLGDSTPTASHMGTILQARSAAADVYLHQYCHKPVAGSELSQTHTQCIYRRTRRLANELPRNTPKFDHYSNNVWQKRQRARQAFIRAARRVLIQIRVQKKLKKIRRLVEIIKNGTEDEELLATGCHAQVSITLPSATSTILPLSFPKSTTHNLTQHTGTASTKDTSFQVKPTEVKVQKQVPLMELKVPHQYQLLGYTASPPPTLGTFIPPDLPRPLRTGAQAELENLGHIPGINLTFLTPSSPPTLTPSPPHTMSTLTTHQTLTVQDVEGQQEKETMKGGTRGFDERAEISVLPLVPPSNLLSTPERHPLHIFNPCPGVLHHLSPLPHSEVTIDHTLLPLPHHPSSCTHTHPALHPQDFIPGVMQWKQFPCHWLVATEAFRRREQPPQSQIHRTTDPFSDGLLPVMSELHLLSGPQPDDLHVVEDHSSSGVLPTPTLEMVRAQFYIPTEHTDSSQEDSRNAECPTDRDQPAVASGLGVRIQQRLDNAMSQFNNTDTRKCSSH